MNINEIQKESKQEKEKKQTTIHTFGVELKYYIFLKEHNINIRKLVERALNDLINSQH